MVSFNSHVHARWLFVVIWLCAPLLHLLREELSVEGALDYLLERTASFKIYHCHFSMISYPWPSIPQLNQHSQTAINVAVIASIQLRYYEYHGAFQSCRPSGSLELQISCLFA